MTRLRRFLSTAVPQTREHVTRTVAGVWSLRVSIRSLSAEMIELWPTPEGSYERSALRPAEGFAATALIYESKPPLAAAHFRMAS